MKRLHENEKKQTITVSIAAGTYDIEVIVDLLNQAIQDNEDSQTYRQKTKLVLSNGKSFFREVPKIIDAQGRTAFQLQDEIKSIGISRVVNWPICLVLSITQSMEVLLSQ